MSRPTELPPPGAPDVIYIVDISGYVFRSYHALVPLSTKSGEPTHATLGTLNMLAKLLRERKPVRVAVAMEGGNSLRTEIDARYKATRPVHPEDLSIQIKRTKQLVEGYRVPILYAPGYEADDMIAAAVTKAKAAGYRVVISSADKDLLQLVDDKCCMWDTMRDRVYGPAEVMTKFGIPVARVRDFLALVGDTSDNIPGVKGVGEKTATALLTQFATLEEIYENLDKVEKPRWRQLLAEHKDDAFISQNLVTLRADAPLEFDAEKLLYHGPDQTVLQPLFRELEFVRYITSDARPPKPKAEAIVATYETILDKAALSAFAARVRAAKKLAITAHLSETDVMRAEFVGIALACELGGAAYAPMAHRYLGVPAQVSFADFAEVFAPLLADPGIARVGHDDKRTEVALREHGVKVGPFVYDAMIASYLLDPELPNDLASVADREAGVIVPSLEKIVAKQKGRAARLEDATVEEATPYAAAFADVALRLYERHASRLKEMGVDRVLSDIEMPLSSELADLEIRGVLVDTTVLGAIGETMASELARLEARAREVSGHPDLNVGSPKQLEAILFDELGLKAGKKTKTGRSTDAEALEAIADDHELPQIVLDHRAIAKLKGTYVDALPRLVHPKTGRVHCHWRQAVAATGRISSEEPNLQNIPTRTDLGRAIRRAFIAPPGMVFMSADYSQIELRVLAHLSKDPVLIDAFQKGQDIHTRTSMEVFGVPLEEVTPDMRRKSKAVNFGVIYGMGENALAKRTGTTRAEAGKFIKAYFDRYQGVAAFMKSTMEEARRTEKVRTLLGRIRILPDLRNSDHMKRSYAERIAQNTPIQGTAADILKLAMVRLREPVEEGVRMILTVHDELCFEVPEAQATSVAAKTKAAMETVLSLDVPLTVDVRYGKSWADAH
ncbi:MAG: DNA polymerase I [Polyangiaceae bacterium]